MSTDRVGDEVPQRGDAEARTSSASAGHRRSDTRKQLILAGERLFAERGIEGVSLREINLAANQRNTSAAHYHFGSKEALIDAIFEFRRTEFGQRREALLDELEAAGNLTARGLAKVWIEPLAHGVEEGADAGCYYVQFLAQLLVTSPKLAAEVLGRHSHASNGRMHKFARRALPHVPPCVLTTRVSLMGRHAAIAISSFIRGGSGTIPLGFGAFVSDLIDSTAGFLAAPVSSDTLALCPDPTGRGAPPVTFPMH